MVGLSTIIAQAVNTATFFFSLREAPRTQLHAEDWAGAHGVVTGGSWRGGLGAGRGPRETEMGAGELEVHRALVIVEGALGMEHFSWKHSYLWAL